MTIFSPPVCPPDFPYEFPVFPSTFVAYVFLFSMCLYFLFRVSSLLNARLTALPSIPGLGAASVNSPFSTTNVSSAWIFFFLSISVYSFAQCIHFSGANSSTTAASTATSDSSALWVALAVYTIVPLSLLIALTKTGEATAQQTSSPTRYTSVTSPQSHFLSPSFGQPSSPHSNAASPLTQRARRPPPAPRPGLPHLVFSLSGLHLVGTYLFIYVPSLRAVAKPLLWTVFAIQQILVLALSLRVAAAPRSFAASVPRSQLSRYILPIAAVCFAAAGLPLFVVANISSGCIFNTFSLTDVFVIGMLIPLGLFFHYLRTEHARASETALWRLIC
jgi:hypothetical protein